MADPVARSPIRPAGPVEVRNGWEISVAGSSAGLTLTDASSLAKVVVRSDTEVFDTPYGRSDVDASGALVVGSAPGEWLLIGGAGAGSDLAGGVPRRGFTVVIDLTHGRALMRLTGQAAAATLAKLCSVDLADDMAPDGAAFRSSVAAVMTDVVRHDLAGVPSYLLHCERSSGNYLYEMILDAGAEFGIEPGGSTTDLGT